MFFPEGIPEDLMKYLIIQNDTEYTLKLDHICYSSIQKAYHFPLDEESGDPHFDFLFSSVNRLLSWTNRPSARDFSLSLEDFKQNHPEKPAIDFLEWEI